MRRTKKEKKDKEMCLPSSPETHRKCMNLSTTTETIGPRGPDHAVDFNKLERGQCKGA